MKIEILNLSVHPFVRFLFLLILTFHFLFSPPTVRAIHTYHTSLTRIDYNEREKLAEITIQIFTHDLVPLLEKRAKKNIDLEKTPETDDIILKYLTENFVLKDKQTEVKKIVWVGKQVRADTVFVYIEIPLEKDLENFQLQNSLFFDSFSEQVNIVIVRSGDKKSDLSFKVGDKFKEIKFIKTTEK